MRYVMGIGMILMTIILVLPAILVTGFSKDEPGIASNNEDNERMWSQDGIEEPVISVYRAEKDIIEDVLFEDYIIGVVASEMPATYEVEALKAQALTARTYILQKLTAGDDIQLPDGADVLDTVMHQVFTNHDELRERWGDNYDKNYARVKQAVLETQGQVITYNGKPITASYFSTSNGYTENSEEYWMHEIPYLRSVESPWDLNSPRYDGEKTFTVEKFEELLGVTVTEGTVGDIVSRTTGGRVAKVKIGDKELTGREIRDRLGLDSSDFTWHRNGNEIEIDTRGWGHGVGMSQFGANGMAKEGKMYPEIIHHYYQDVQIEEAGEIINVTLNKQNNSNRASTTKPVKTNES